MVFRNKTASTDPAHQEALAWDKQSRALIERLRACRIAVNSEDTAGLGDRFSQTVRGVVETANDRLTECAEAYRKGNTVKSKLDSTSEALEMVDGLLGRASKTQHEALGARIRDVHLSLLGATEDNEGVKLGRELVENALADIAEAFNRSYTFTHSTNIDRATTAIGRAAEALRPDSAGVKLVSRLEGLKAKLRLVTSRAA
ncbi:MAG TPA: hypothetical protein V6D22_07700 [Candidatus Obscuribacterales bacterium]